MNFDSPSSVLTETNQMLLAQQTIMSNRTLVNRLMNGDPPETEESRRAQNLKTSVNYLEGQRIVSNAIQQLNSAFFKGNQYFKVSVDYGPAHKRSLWSTTITKCINKELKKSRSYKCARESAHAQVVLHGPGPVVWRNRRTPIPDTAGIEDVLVPSGTLADMENLDYLSLYRELTWSQLENAAFGKVADPGWNKDYAKALLATLYKMGLQPIYQGNRWLFPEKLAEDYKEGAAQTMSSSMPKILAWDFFYRNEDTGKWNRKMVIDYANIAPDYELKESDQIMKNQQFLYERDDYADDWSEIIHWYIGNCSVVGPYRYHSIRSMGYLLYGISMIMNKTRCRFQDHIFQSMLTWFKNVSDDNREKLQMIDLHNFGVFPEGVSMVTANERHSVDWNLVVGGLSQGRQLMAESAMNFIPQVPGDPSHNKTMTASEYIGRQNESIAMTSAVHTQLADQAVYEYREICRRFCIKDNPDPMAKRFRENIRKEGVPLEALDCEKWDIIPEKTAGGGNKSVELTVAQVAFDRFMPIVDPDAQRIISRNLYLALTDNPEEAMLVIPDAPNQENNDVQYAQVAYSVLMDGIPFIVKEGVNHLAYAGTLMMMMQVTGKQVAQVMQQQSGISIAAEKIAGLFNVGQHVQQQLEIIGRDENKRDVAKKAFQNLKAMMSELQRMAEQLTAMEQEQQQRAGGVDPETQAKIQERMLLAHTNAQISQAKAAQKQEQSDVKFYSENQRKNAMTQAEIQRKLALTQTDVISKDMTTSAEITRIQNEPASKE